GQHFARGADAASQSPLDGARLACGVRCLAGKVQRAVERACQRLAGMLAADGDIAVSAVRVRILLPVVVVMALELACDLEPLAEERLQTRGRGAHDVGWRSLRCEMPRARTARPGDEQRYVRGSLSPECRHFGIGQVKERHLAVAPGVDVLPEAGGK